MRWLRFFGNLDGRIGRKTFWLASLAVLAVEFVVGLVAAVAVASLVGDDDSPAVDWTMDIVLLVFLYPQFVIAVKRGHDRNISLSIIAAFYAAFVGRDVLEDFGWLVRNPDQNMFSGVNVVSFLATLLVGLLALAFLIELGFRRGTPGPNRYGLDPLGKP
jgi:uncharacterized membrane protein YhaH (DUF805 family)